MASGCTETTPQPIPGHPASLQIIAGQDQHGVVGAELPVVLEVKVLDAAGNAVSGQIVNFKVVLGGGSVFAGAAITTSAGIAKERWTLGTSVADSQRVEVRAIDSETGDAQVFGTFNAVAIADVPAAVVISQGNGQTVTAGGAAPESLTVRVNDKFGNPAPGATVAWAVASGGGAVSPASVTTNASGVAQTRWTVGSSVANAQQVTATVGSLTAASFTANPVAATATTLVLAQSAVGASAGNAFTVQPTVRLADTNGNPDLTATAPVTLTVTSGATTIGTATVVPSNGVATFTNTGLSGTVGDYTLTFTATLGGTAKTATQSITLLAGTASKYIVTPQTTATTVGSTVGLSAQLSDASGNPISTAGRSVTWIRVGAGGTFTSTTSTTNGSGVATTSFVVDTAYTTGSVQLAATDANSVSGSATVSVATGPATKLVFKTQPSAAAYGITLTSTSVSVSDGYGNTVTGDTRTISVALGSGTLAGTTSKPAVAGIATFSDLVINTSGVGFSLVANASGVSQATTPNFAVDPIGLLGPASGSGEVAVAGSDVYFAVANNATVNKVATRGGAISEVASIGTQGPWMGRVRVDGGFVDVSNNLGTLSSGGAIRRIPLDGSAATSIGTFGGSGNPGSCAVAPDLEFDGTYFYLACIQCHSCNTVQNARLERLTTDGVQLRLDTLNQNGSRPAVTIAGGYVYFSDSVAATAGNTINRIPVDGGTRTALVSGATMATTGSRRLIVIGSTMYWAEQGAGGATSGSIRSAPITGGSSTTLASGLSASVRNFIVDGSSLLFNDGGTIKRMSLSDFSVATVLAGQGVIEFTVDGPTIYFKTGTQLKKTAK